MVDFVFKGGNEGEMNAAINAIDIALWEIKAKIADEPLWQTFGAREGRTKAYASGIDLCLDDDAIFTFYRRMAEKGVDFRQAKSRARHEGRPPTYRNHAGSSKRCKPSAPTVNR